MFARCCASETGRVLQRKSLSQDADGTALSAERVHRYKTFVYRALNGVPVEGHRAVVTHGLDGSFVRDMLEDPIDRAMVEVINHIGHVMGKLTIAEFVESEEILQALREIGVDYAQGYVIARPQPFALSGLAEAPQGEWLAAANPSS